MTFELNFWRRKSLYIYIQCTKERSSKLREITKFIRGYLSFPDLKAYKIHNLLYLSSTPKIRFPPSNYKCKREVPYS